MIELRDRPCMPPAADVLSVVDQSPKDKVLTGSPSAVPSASAATEVDFTIPSLSSSDGSDVSDSKQVDADHPPSASSPSRKKKSGKKAKALKSPAPAQSASQLLPDGRDWFCVVPSERVSSSVVACLQSRLVQCL